MSISRIVLTISALVLVVVLFYLPQSVVDNKKEAAPKENSVHVGDSKSEQQAHLHTKEIPDLDVKRITFFTESYYNNQNKEKNANFADSLANLYQKYERWDSAAKYFEAIAKIYPEEKNLLKAGNSYYEAFSISVDAENAQVLSEKAREFYKKVLDRNPHSLDVKTRLALTYVSTSTPMQGILMLREVLEEDPNHNEALYNMGILSYRSGQYDKAVGRFEKLIEIDSSNIQARYYLGVSYFELNQKVKAKEQFELLKKQDKDPEVQAAADEYLSKLR